MSDDDEKPLTWAERMRLELMSTPEGRKALAKAEETEKFLIEQPCSEGNCLDLIDTRTGENVGGWGPVGCPCQEVGDV
jgi:hypothetical protein